MALPEEDLAGSFEGDGQFSGGGCAVVGREGEVQVVSVEAVGDRIAEAQPEFLVGGSYAVVVSHGLFQQEGVAREGVGLKADIGPRRIPGVSVLKVVAEGLPFDGEGRQQQDRQPECFA